MPTSPAFPFFFFNDTATTEIYTLSLHDALPICRRPSTKTWLPLSRYSPHDSACLLHTTTVRNVASSDRKSTRLNSSHLVISYAVFCLKKKKIPIAHRGRQHSRTSMTPCALDLAP